MPSICSVHYRYSTHTRARSHNVIRSIYSVRYRYTCSGSSQRFRPRQHQQRHTYLPDLFQSSTRRRFVFLPGLWARPCRCPRAEEPIKRHFHRAVVDLEMRVVQIVPIATYVVLRGTERRKCIRERPFECALPGVCGRRGRGWADIAPTSISLLPAPLSTEPILCRIIMSSSQLCI
eukprot:COSAG06_NODE_6362_length_2965_cov_61.988137_3_plen_176_part_00